MGANVFATCELNGQVQPPAFFDAGFSLDKELMRRPVAERLARSKISPCLLKAAPWLQERTPCGTTGFPALSILASLTTREGLSDQRVRSPWSRRVLSISPRWSHINIPHFFYFSKQKGRSIEPERLNRAIFFVGSVPHRLLGTFIGRRCILKEIFIIIFLRT